MSLSKAKDLLRLAEMAAARHAGVSLADIVEEFDADHRTAQRMTKALEDAFPGVEIRTDADRRRRWKLRDTSLLRMQGIRDSELAALEMSIRRAEREGAIHEVRTLTSLRDRLLATMPSSHARRAEADAEAVLEAYGYASRPGPRVKSEPLVLETIAQALKGPFRLVVSYAGPKEKNPRERILEPYGLLIGVRRYLVAREVGKSGGFQHYRLDRMRHARLDIQTFARDAEFDLSTHAARAFGSFHADKEFGEVVWRFRPEAAAIAREFEFHPDQEVAEEEDGSLVVRFQASGWLEMAWHLYQWGDKVEVVTPVGLRKMVENYGRSDFPAMP
ncbi:WYL domain-containing protein [Tabrizicola sp. J26]|uniref:helix-turn-helix transcriptional regulator n=1 Tax=Alitabrizicola rongguiensis TaxID=2909234 RepID=UPI001F462E3F|nr:WYL domain-containing protein [Tabrizicola rongguiensis]MCF1708692.1 WYL domain-containing protein [Tabrizicola rongguiensis]